MSGSVNRVIIVGNLGQEPEVKTTASGKKITNLSIATSETFNDREGQRQERTEWHRIVLFDKLAELAERYLAKGRKVYVEGRLQTRSWDDQQTGQKRYSTEIVATQLVFLSPGGDGGGGERGWSSRGAAGGHNEPPF